MALCRLACGGHCSTFLFLCCASFLHLHVFSALPPHFLSSFCSVTLSLLTRSLFLSHTNVLSRHCFPLLPLSLSFSLTPFPQVLPLLDPQFHFWWTFIFSPSLSLSCPSLVLISVVCLPLFCSGFLIDAEASALSSAVSSTSNRMWAH